ncbi:hypothetical protein ANN_18936 [Periplaneta americana]|uniref:Uncharacterized protein n=1 Tax=Periplaneta americana TaxID=6978 RepID=A0ABQ8SSA4_PERAM|nr:hypothetical protein ANN_18936 [Periplaneta americana]
MAGLCEGGNEPADSLKAIWGGSSLYQFLNFSFLQYLCQDSFLKSTSKGAKHLGRAVGMEPVLLGHLGSMNLGQGLVGCPHWPYTLGLIMLLTDFEIAGGKSGAGEEPREDHVNGYRHATGNITLTNLNILYLCGCKERRELKMVQ